MVMTMAVNTKNNHNRNHNLSSNADLFGITVTGIIIITIIFTAAAVATTTFGITKMNYKQQRKSDKENASAKFPIRNVRDVSVFLGDL